jgi:hypothetical protein
MLRHTSRTQDLVSASCSTMHPSGIGSCMLSVAYENGSGRQIQESFTIENLYDRAVHMYLRRSKRDQRDA